MSFSSESSNHVMTQSYLVTSWEDPIHDCLDPLYNLLGEWHFCEVTFVFVLSRVDEEAQLHAFVIHQRQCFYINITSNNYQYM